MAAHVNDIGTVIRLRFRDQKRSPLDISGQTDIEFRFRKPSGAVFTRAPVLWLGGNGGQAQYVTVDGDLDESGAWEVQGFVTLTTGSWSSEIARVQVEPNIEA